MPQQDCKGGCGKSIRNPPSRKICGYCRNCLEGRGIINGR